jgi:conjugal transfer pilus assembly protein TraV
MNMSGLDASSNYSCPAPPGVVCKPMSEVYRSRTPSLSEQPAALAAKAEVKAKETSEDIQILNSTLPAAPFVIGDYRPLRSQPKILRIWVGPFQDSDGDLHEEHRMYLQVDSGHWMIAHHEEEIRNAFAPLHASPTAKNAPDSHTEKLQRQPDKSPTGVTGAASRTSGDQPDAFGNAPGTGALK